MIFALIFIVAFGAMGSMANKCQKKKPVVLEERRTVNCDPTVAGSCVIGVIK